MDVQRPNFQRVKVCGSDKCERGINTVTTLVGDNEERCQIAQQARQTAMTADRCRVCASEFNGSLHFPSVGVDDGH